MVTPAAPPRRYSIHDLDKFPDDGKLRELVDGQVVEWDVPTRMMVCIQVPLTDTNCPSQ